MDTDMGTEKVLKKDFFDVAPITARNKKKKIIQ